MAAARVEVVLEDGVQNVFCLACGQPICDVRHGVSGQMCRHVLFLYDWDGELWIPESDGHYCPDTIENIAACWEKCNHWGEAEAQIVASLPTSCMVICFDEPARGENDEGGYLAVGLEMAAE